IRGLIKAGDSTGIEHRGKLFLGKGAELNELHRKVYKGMTVFQLIFILSKGSILFVFTLIFILLNVHRSFEKFLMFGVCAVLEEVLAGDYLYAYLDLHQQLFLFTLVNAGAVFFLALFFADLLNLELKAKRIRNTAVGLFLASVLMTIDALYT